MNVVHSLTWVSCDTINLSKQLPEERRIFHHLPHGSQNILCVAEFFDKEFNKEVIEKSGCMDKRLIQKRLQTLWIIS
jgi:hypothetical protein